ncbi:hypothetical protein EV356DRAFT_507908 [Viridothelium virens]|uniref:tRNA-splicing endonuclease subunit Sen15 domain-containing protein n=1 Tax=Viridothelium virens TaxID=1048519 RepID=A0A6A6GYS2_VIRVR|nr:hypothetical protein EV356DRAFT_507908 [Viridothelium virens]
MALSRASGPAARLSPPPSALSETMKTAEDNCHEPYLHHLAQRVAHNLQYQHQWTAISIHTNSPLADSHLLPRPIISGLPPQRIYVHPDEQIELLKDESKRKAESTASKPEGPVPEREWVLPAHLKEKWSLKSFAAIFDEIGTVPRDPDDQKQDRDDISQSVGTSTINKWRTIKRVMLATVDDDGTIVYYIVHDGIVKPRQN